MQGGYDNDTIRPSELSPVDITWPGLVCFEGTTQARYARYLQMKRDQ